MVIITIYIIKRENWLCYTNSRVQDIWQTLAVGQKKMNCLSTIWVHHPSLQRRFLKKKFHFLLFPHFFYLEYRVFGSVFGFLLNCAALPSQISQGIFYPCLVMLPLNELNIGSSINLTRLPVSVKHASI